MTPQRILGKQGLQVSAIGYGAMVAEGWYGAVEEAAAVDTIRHALDIGVNFIDTADAHSNGHNETLGAKPSKAGGHGKRSHFDPLRPHHF